jgi:hypothetical protein
MVHGTLFAGRFSARKIFPGDGRFFAGQFFAGQFFAGQFFAQLILRRTNLSPNIYSPDNSLLGYFFARKFFAR